MVRGLRGQGAIGVTQMPARVTWGGVEAEVAGGAGDIVAVRQGNVFGTSFHPELTKDQRIHVWWLGEVIKALEAGC